MNSAPDPTDSSSVSPGPSSTIHTSNDPSDAAMAAKAKAERLKQEEAARTATYIVVAVILTIILLTVAVYFLVPPHILKAFCPCCAPCLQHKDDYVKHRKMLNDSHLENVRLEMTASSNARRLSVQQGDDGMYTNQSIDRRSRLTQVKSRKVGSIEVRDNPMNLFFATKERHGDYEYDTEKLDKARKMHDINSRSSTAVAVGVVNEEQYEEEQYEEEEYEEGNEGVLGELPEGWESAFDEDGDEYWYNHDLGESTYDRPT